MTTTAKTTNRTNTMAISDTNTIGVVDADWILASMAVALSVLPVTCVGGIIVILGGDVGRYVSTEGVNSSPHLRAIYSISYWPIFSDLFRDRTKP